MKRIATTTLLLGLAIVAPHCGGTTAPQAGSESHFLGPCRVTSDCESGLECHCFVCTRSCGVDAECTGLSPAATCGAADTLAPTCDETIALCQIGCAESADCASSDLACVGGTCLQPELTAEGGTPEGGGAGQGGAGGSVAVAGRGGSATGGTGNMAGNAGSPQGGSGGGALSDGGPTSSDGGPPAVPPCDGDAASCFCTALATCAPDEGFEALPLGSRGYRVCGTAGDGCAVNTFNEVEGGLQAYRCYAARGAACAGDTWTNLSAMACDLVTTCNVLLGDCPADVLSCAPADPAPSCAEMDPGLDNCCAGYGVSSTSGMCACICPDGPTPLFGSQEACEAACGTPPLTCAAVDPYSFGDCTSVLGAGFDGYGCTLVSGCDWDDRLFTTRDACWAACNRSCTDVASARETLLEQSKGCSTDDDCMWVEAGYPPYDHCSCAHVVSRNLDINTWRNLNFAYDCFAQDGCCDAVTPPAVCVDGRCAAGTF